MTRPKAKTASRILLGVAIGLAAGVGGFTFIYGKGASYLTNDPGACANCHIMRDHYNAWLKSSHGAVAVCNDCHTPDSFFMKYATKASNGFWHSVAFTSGRFHEPLRIKPGNRVVTEEACRKCHQELVESVEGSRAHSGEISCIRCHDSVGHLR